MFWCFLICPLAVCLPQAAGTHPLYCRIAFLSVETGEIPSLYDWLVAAFNSFTHISRGWCSPGDDEGTTEHTCTGQSRWGTRVAPFPLLTLLLWQQHVAFLCVSNTSPRELPLFRCSVAFLWLVLSITTDFAIEAHVWVLGKDGRSRRGSQNLPEGAAGEAPQNHVLAGGQRTAGAEAVTWGLPCRGGAAAQQERQGKRIIPLVVGWGINWERRN